MKIYINKETNKYYYEGRSITHSTETELFSGIPSEEQLLAWGYEEYIAPTPVPISEEEQTRIDNLDEIERLKEELAAGDYKIIKCCEARLLVQEMPYDLESLVEERNEIRQRINELEATL